MEQNTSEDLITKKLLIKQLFNDEVQINLIIIEDHFILSLNHKNFYPKFLEEYTFLTGMQKVCEILECSNGDEIDRHQEKANTYGFGCSYNFKWKFW